jgi:hypothetical protein
MFRFLLLVTVLAIAWCCIETRYAAERSELTLRLRRSDELASVASEGARGLGSWIVRWWGDAQDDRRPAEEITWKDRQELDELVREKTQDSKDAKDAKGSKR